MDESFSLRIKPKKFKNCIVLQKSDPKIVVKLFSNGGMHCTGGRSVQGAKDMCEEICGSIKRYTGIDAQLKEMNIQMINTNVSINTPIDLDKTMELIEKTYKWPVCLNKENHSALNIKLKTPEMSKTITVLIFTSGSIIFTGGNNAKDIWEAYTEILSKLDMHADTIRYTGVFKSKKRMPGEPPRKRGRKRKVEHMEFYEGLDL